LNKTDWEAHICNYEQTLTFRRQIAVTIETAEHYCTVPCSNYWNLTCQILNAYNRKRNQFQN